MPLALAVDSAYPFDFAQRPPGTAVIMGYVGRDGYTPHVWTRAEVDRARATGCEWWPIGVGISGGATNANDGLITAQTMIARLPGYGVAKSAPVFQDIEPNAYHANPTSAAECAAAFKTAMHGAGYPHAYTYCTPAPFAEWQAVWSNVRPASLPAGIIGIQYTGAASPPAYDISVFDAALLSGPGPGGPDLDSTEHQMLVDLWNERTHLDNTNFLVGQIATSVNSILAHVHTIVAAGQSNAQTLSVLKVAADNLAAAVGKLAPGAGGTSPNYTGTVSLQPAP